MDSRTPEGSMDNLYFRKALKTKKLYGSLSLALTHFPNLKGIPDFLGMNIATICYTFIGQQAITRICGRQLLVMKVLFTIHVIIGINTFLLIRASFSPWNSWDVYINASAGRLAASLYKLDVISWKLSRKTNINVI